MTAPFLVVLGVAQDAGLPQAGCRRACCRAARRDPRLRRRAACLGIVDPGEGKRWMADCTPDFREQLAAFDRAAALPALDGILLTHAHTGHYTGLIALGREAMGARGMPVHAMPRMRRFLTANGPWELLVRLGNVALRPLAAGRPLRLTSRLAVTPRVVPHRQEYSETVCFEIAGPRRRALWLPDIDRWEPWATRIEDALARVDAAWLDGTFFDEKELKGRDAAEVPHPTIASTLERLGSLPARERRKVRFVHLNHTNPAHRSGSAARRAIERMGMRVAREGERFSL
jgi:pyrroloquinoline quinone biosynthesis protein B